MKPLEVPIRELVSRCSTSNPKQRGEGSFSYIDLSSVDKDSKQIAVVEDYLS